MGVFGGVLSGLGQGFSDVAKGQIAARAEKQKQANWEKVQALGERQQSLAETQEHFKEKLSAFGKLTGSVVFSQDGKTGYAMVDVPGKGIQVRSFQVPEGMAAAQAPEAIVESNLKAYKDIFKKDMPDDMKSRLFATAYGIPYSKGAVKVVREKDPETGQWVNHFYDTMGELVGTGAGEAPTPGTEPKATITAKETDPFSGKERTTVSTTYGKSTVASPTAKLAKPGAPSPRTPQVSPTQTKVNMAKFATDNPEALKVRLGWNDVAPSPTFQEMKVPRKYWKMIDDAAVQLIAGNKVLPPLTAKNLQLRSAITGRARELGWTGGPPATGNEIDAAKWARAAKDKIPGMLGLIDTLDKQGKLGPIAGRYQEFMAGQIGAGDVEYSELRGYINLLSTAMMRAHVGARGGVNLMSHFETLWQAGKMDAPTLKAGIKVMDNFLASYSNLDKAMRSDLSMEDVEKAAGFHFGATQTNTSDSDAASQYLKSKGLQ